MSMTLEDHHARTGARLKGRAAEQHLFPLWEMTTLHQTGEPRPADACHWRWASLSPLIEQAVAETNTENAERRVLLLGNPAFENPAAHPHVTPVLQVGIQTLMPGESARAHRHTPNALRFVLEGHESACTVVDGKRCRMERGDVILTPAFTWHSHYNEGSTRSVWVDVLDSQLSAYLDAGFFESAAALQGGMPPTLPDAAFAEPGLAPVPTDGMASAYSPRFRFPWAATLAALDAAPVQDDGCATVRLVNPLGGGGAMPHMDCRMLRFGRLETRGSRSTAAAVCVVAAGTGVSRIGAQELHWKPNDIFTLPQWAWTRHRAESDDAVLFIVSDRDVLSRLDLLREESA